MDSWFGRLMIIKATGMKRWNNSFHIDEHKVNNTGWMMKWWWNRGWNERQTPILRECWTFLIYIFLHQQRKQCLEFMLTKLREICKYLAGACNSNSHARGLHYLTFVCKTKQGKSMQWGESSRKMIQKSSALSIHFKTRRSLLQIEFTTFAAKKPRPLCEIWIEKRIGEKGIVWPQAYNAQYNAQRRGVWEISGGGGGGAFKTWINETG